MCDKVVLVTGGARRVGASICRALHAKANIAIHYHRSASEAQALQNELNAKREASSASFQSDVTLIERLPHLIEQVVARFGRLDAIVNNASSFYPTPVGSIDERCWDDLIGANLKAPLFLSQAAAPYLKATRGCIVNITDIHADRPLSGYLVYSVAKAGLAALTRALARELGPEVRVNGVAPGPVLWPQNETFDAARRQTIIDSTLLKQAGSPQDVAGAVSYLVLEATYVTGHIIAVDGGRSIYLP